MTKWGALGIAALTVCGVAAGAYSYVSPGIALQEIRDAALQNDRERLRDLVDFPSVRTGLKEDIKAFVLVSAGSALKDNPFAALGIAVATMMVDPLVENIVSPAGFSMMMSKGIIDSPPGAAQRGIPSVGSIQDTSSSDGIDIEKGYQGFSKYRVRYRRTGGSSEALTFTLSRDGLFSWKLTSISFPTDLIPNLQQAKSPSEVDTQAKSPSEVDTPKPAAASSEEKVLIAHVGPITGVISHLGKDNENGVRLAIQQANDEKIKIGGRSVNFVLLTFDDEADPKVGVRVAQQIVEERVAGVVGHLNSGTSIPASMIYNQAGIPVITGSATNPKLTEQGFNTQFRVVGRDDRQGPALAAYIADAVNPNLVAILSDATPYGEGMASDVEKTLKAANIKVLPTKRGRQVHSDGDATIANLIEHRPDVVFFGGMDDVGGPFLKRSRQRGVKGLFAFGDGACTDDMSKLAGDAAEGLICSQAGIPPQAADKRFLEAYEKKFRADPILFSPFTYDAAKMLIAAMQKADSTDPRRYRAELAKLEHVGATGRIAFDANGDRRSAEMTIFAMKNRRLQPIAVVSGMKMMSYEGYLKAVERR